MAKKKLNEANYLSGQKPKSKIFGGLFTRRLSSLYGYQAIEKKNATTNFERNNQLRLVRVDLDNPAYRIKQAALGSIYKSNALATPLEKYLERWMEETNLCYSDIYERQERLKELAFAVYNDPYLSQSCTLTADEATQLDDQNRLLSVESNSVAFVNKCYELFSQWGLTQQRVRSACFDIQRYGEALWSHKVTERGVERIIPLRPRALQERLEFSPARMAEYIADIEGNMQAQKTRRSKLQSLIDLLTKKTGEVDDLGENFADTFDTKLLGFEFADGIIVPPWLITHFRYQADTTEFFPYGTPPLLMALAPFQQAHSTMALQGLARQMSFPVQVYKVKQTEGLGAASAFEITNTVREEYDNIGVTPQSNSLEVYTINTKIWVPDGLLTFEIQSAKVDMDFVGDLEMYNDRVAYAAGVPKGYIDQEFGGFGQSGIALMEQYKPFARHVYTIQSAFLEGLGQLIRLHFAITGEFDYNTPFVLSMRFPAEDMGEEKMSARTASIDLASSIIEMLQGVLGLEEGEALPEDVVSSILGKYTFLDPTDLTRWIRLAAIQKSASENAAPDGDDEDMGGDDFGGGEDDADMAGDMAEGGDDMGDASAGIEESSTEERAYYLKTKRLLQEKKRKLTEKTRRLREQVLRERYSQAKDTVFMHFCESQNFTEWQDTARGHAFMVPKINESGPFGDYFGLVKDTYSKQKTGGRIRESETVQDKLEEYRDLSRDEAQDLRDKRVREAIDAQATS
jgi:hypothetical protein